MKNKFTLIGLVVIALTSAASAAFAIEPTVPECNYEMCPGGSQQCCTEGGVTLYKDKVSGPVNPS